MPLFHEENFMLPTLSTLLVLAWPGTLWGATPIPMPSGKKLALNSSSSTNFGVETKTRERPVHIQQDCPSPDLVDYVKTSSWNNVEAGVSFPLDSESEVRLYTRYTCPAPKTEPY